MEHIEFIESAMTDLAAGVGYRSMQDSLEVTDVSINRFHLESGATLPWGIHAHYDQEEVFLVTDGVLTFETLEGETSVAAGEAIRFASGDYQMGRNDSPESVSYFAIGAPPDSTDVRVPLSCHECNGEELRLDSGQENLVCPECGASRSSDCPACGADERAVRLDAHSDALVDRCRSCGDEAVVRRIT